MDNLQALFKKTLDDVGTQINDRVAAAELLLAEAVAISNEHGIPFESGVSQRSFVHSPPTFDIFEGISLKFVANLTGIEVYDLEESSGWNASQVC